MELKKKEKKKAENVNIQEKYMYLKTTNYLSTVLELIYNDILYYFAHIKKDTLVCVLAQSLRQSV